MLLKTAGPPDEIFPEIRARTVLTCAIFGNGGLNHAPCHLGRGWRGAA